MSSDRTSDFLAAFLAASDAHKEMALRSLRGEVLQAPGPEPFLTLKEAATVMHFNPATFWRWQVPGHELGGKRRFKISEITAYFASKEFQNRVATLRAQRQQRRAKQVVQEVAP